MAEKLYASSFYEYPSRMKEHMTMIDQLQEPLLKTNNIYVCDTLVTTNQHIEQMIKTELNK